jgi:hypothetical protein
VSPIGDLRGDLRSGQIVAAIINALGGLKNGKPASALDCLLFKEPEPERSPAEVARALVAQVKARKRKAANGGDR